MKIFVALFCLCLTAISSVAPKPSKEKLAPLVNQCLTEEGGSDSDLASLMNTKFPESPAGRCMITCIHEKAGIFKDGKLEKNAFFEMGKILTNNDEKMMGQVNQLGESCEPSIIGKERCSQGVDFQTCLHAEMAKIGMKIEMF